MDVLTDILIILAKIIGLTFLVVLPLVPISVYFYLFHGDWFLFYMLGQNVDGIIFKEIMHELARKLGHQGKDFSMSHDA